MITFGDSVNVARGNLSLIQRNSVDRSGSSLEIRSVEMSKSQISIFFKPTSWPPFEQLVGALILVPIFAPYTCRFTGWPLRFGSPGWWSLVGLLVGFVLIKAKSIINERYERLKSMKRCKIPVLDDFNPLSGNLFQVFGPRKNFLTLNDLHQKYGKTFGFFYGPDAWLMSKDVELLHQVFVKDANNVMGQLQTPFVAEFSKSLAQLNGEAWKLTRRMLEPSFTLRQMKSDNVMDDIIESVNKSIDYIRETKIEEGGGRIIDVEELFTKFTADSLFRVVFDRYDFIKMHQGVKDPLLESVREAADILSGPAVWCSIMFHSTQRFLGYMVKFSNMGKLMSVMQSFLSETIERRRILRLTKGIAPRDRKMIDSIVESALSNKIEPEIINANMFFMFLAGFETSSRALAIMFWLLAKHPEVEAKLRESILRDGEQSEYLQWVINETMRLYPPVPTGNSRIIQRDTEHKGMLLPAGTTICTNIYGVHRDSDYWGPDADEFRPERFGEPLMHPSQFHPFGLGQRYCMGMNFAQIELRAIIVRILYNFKVESCDKTPDKLDLLNPNLIHFIVEHPVEIRFVELQPTGGASSKSEPVFG